MCSPRNIFVFLLIGLVVVSSAAPSEQNDHDHRLVIIVEGIENVKHLARK